MRIIYSDTFTGEHEYTDLPLDTPFTAEGVRQALVVFFSSFELIPMPLAHEAWVVDSSGGTACFVYRWDYGDECYLIHGSAHTKYDPNWVIPGMRKQ